MMTATCSGCREERVIVKERGLAQLCLDCTAVLSGAAFGWRKGGDRVQPSGRPHGSPGRFIYFADGSERTLHRAKIVGLEAPRNIHRLRPGVDRDWQVGPPEPVFVRGGRVRRAEETP